MDAYGNHFNYSSHEQNYESYPCASNFEESQNQVFDQQYFEDEHYNEYGQYYGDGGFYEDGIHSYNQQRMCNEGYDQWSEQPNYYDEDSYDQCYSNYQLSGEPSDSEHQIDYLEKMLRQQGEMLRQQEEMMDEYRALQEKMFKDLEIIRAHQAKEMEYNQEVHESQEDQPLEESIETLESSASADYMIRLCSTSSTDDELEPCLEGTPEGDDFVPERFDLHEGMVEEDIDLNEPCMEKFRFEDQPEVPRKFDLHESTVEEDIDLNEPCMEKFRLEDQLEMPRRFKLHKDLVEENIDLYRPCMEKFISEEEDVELRTPKCQNIIVEDWWSVEPWSCVEDPYLLTLPPSKFWSFRPYFEKSIEWNSYGPSIFKEVNLSRGSEAIFDVHLKLGGRKFKWDIKIS